jgi:hypothetical protein
MISIHTILARKFKGRKYSCIGESLDGLTILDDLKPITQKELDAAAKIIEQEDIDNLYVVSRAREYPLISDQLDMLWHAMDSGEIPKAKEFYLACKAVKDKYPKI